MSEPFFCEDTCSIINNLNITNKKYFVAIYLVSIEKNKLKKNKYSIKIYLKGVGINTSSKTASTSASISGTTNTTNDIAKFYVSVLNEGVNLIYSNLSTINEFNNCNNSNTISIFNPVNNIDLISTDIMKFDFEILNIKTKRQGGQTVNAYVEYQYVNFYTNFNYDSLRAYIKKVIESTVDPYAYWENLVIYLAHYALNKYKEILGIKIKLVVLDNPIGPFIELGNHGPTYVYGVFQ